MTSAIDTLLNKRKTVEVQVDRSVCTVVSCLPFQIREQKPGLFPIGLFCLPPAKKDIEVLVVREGFYFRYIGEGKQIEQYEKAELIARAVVNDFNNAQLGLDLSHEDVEDNAQPGLFWVYGAWEVPDIKAMYADKLALAQKQQTRWFGRLVQIADDDWAKYHQHKMISDLQRYAASALGAPKEWSAPHIVAATMDTCPACRSNIPAGALVCMVCKTVVNPEGYAKLGLKQIG